jgi:hypothetical protein
MTKSLSESQRYISYMKSYMNLFVLLPLAGMTLASLVYHIQPPLVETSQLFEMQYDSGNIPARVQLADEAVTLLRSSQVHHLLRLSEGNKISLYKSGPLLINIVTNGKEKNMVEKDNELIAGYLETKFPVNQIGGLITYTKKVSPYYYLGAGLFAGALITLLFSLIREYFRNF